MFANLMLALIGRATAPARPVYTGAIRTVTDLRTGETLRVSLQAVARDSRGRIRTTRVLGR